MLICIWICVGKNEMYVYVRGIIQICKNQHLLRNCYTSPPELRARCDARFYFVVSF
jgi:hypothetical protein